MSSAIFWASRSVTSVASFALHVELGPADVDPVARGEPAAGGDGNHLLEPPVVDGNDHGPNPTGLEPLTTLTDPPPRRPDLVGYPGAPTFEEDPDLLSPCRQLDPAFGRTGARSFALFAWPSIHEYGLHRSASHEEEDHGIEDGEQRPRRKGEGSIPAGFHLAAQRRSAAEVDEVADRPPGLSRSEKGDPQRVGDQGRDEDLRRHDRRWGDSPEEQESARDMKARRLRGGRS